MFFDRPAGLYFTAPLGALSFDAPPCHASSCSSPALSTPPFFVTPEVRLSLLSTETRLSRARVRSVFPVFYKVWDFLDPPCRTPLPFPQDSWPFLPSGFTCSQFLGQEISADPIQASTYSPVPSSLTAEPSYRLHIQGPSYFFSLRENGTGVKLRPFLIPRPFSLTLCRRVPSKYSDPSHSPGYVCSFNIRILESGAVSLTLLFAP